ncbi:MAG TPA: ABC transporter substrate-binding protein [Thermomicrobiales bacterium]|nr:ABC transporter substrate-binding protein [Thermomicrobiales bacterium]
MRTFRTRKISRRQFAAGSAVFATVAVMPGIRVAAQDASPAASPVSIAIINDGTPEDELEVFSWWTGPGEHDGLVKLYEAFNGLFPDVKIIDAAVAGGAGSNAKAALSTRLEGGDPPDSWQSHAAKELQDLYQGPGYTGSVTDIWNTLGLDDVIPEGLNDQVTIDGEKYLIPVGVHMGNVLFANKQVAEDNGLDWSENLSTDDFFAMADTLKEAGIPAIALGSKDSFAPVQLFENTLMAQLGGDAYLGLWDGSTDWTGDDVKSAIETFGKYLDYVNDDHASLTWDGAMDLVLNGTAFATSMGDWAYGAAVSKDKTDVVRWSYHPGSEGLYVAVMDGFTLPTEPPHPVNAQNWLGVVGSAEAQATFAPYKGCIPARTDADISGLSDYGKWSADQFGQSQVVVSIAHGTAASPQQTLDITDAITSFLVDKDVDALQDALNTAAQDAD